MKLTTLLGDPDSPTKVLVPHESDDPEYEIHPENLYLETEEGWLTCLRVRFRKPAYQYL